MQEIKRIPLEGAHNTRDLGGYETLDGRRLRRRRLLRSGDLSALTQHDIDTLTREYDLKTVIDFRTAAERAEKPDVEMPGVTRIVNPILQEETLGITREQQSDQSMAGLLADMLKGKEGQEAAGIGYMRKLYGELITNDYSRKQYRRFFQILNDQETGAVLWHCSAGKDRVGTGAMLLLSALRVPREQIIADYMKVNDFAREGIDRIIESIISKTGDRSTAAAIRTLFSVHESYIESVYDTIDTRFGSMDQFMEHEMGLSGERLEHLRALYLE